MYTSCVGVQFPALRSLASQLGLQYLILSQAVDLAVIADLLHALQVRYESRRRLAETRPRVRGQFVKAGTAAAQSLAAQAIFSHQ